MLGNSMPLVENWLCYFPAGAFAIVQLCQVGPTQTQAARVYCRFGLRRVGP